MKYVALLSGGKDSCFNVMHCSANGHELVAAATLGPKEGKEEIDSYLYQTVGQDAISLVADALDVPLYRGTIQGTAVNADSCYGSRDSSKLAGDMGDETEDLLDLLTIVKSRHPEIRGVSVGAILSNYQRVRVEHVCQRLSLTPLCFLWQRDQSELLQEMLDSGMEAILIKVAGIGLTSKHLGRTLGDMQPHLLRLESLYGSHVCGEGGEYETLTLNCPQFKRRIVLDETETVVHSDNDFATVAYLRIKVAHLEDKEPSQAVVCPPKLVTDEFMDYSTTERCSTSQTSLQLLIGALSELSFTPPSAKRTAPWVVVNNVFRNPNKGSCTFKEEVQDCLELIRDKLQEQVIPFSRIVHLHVLVSDMSNFADMNSVYGTFFGSSPPARTCVSVDLPPGVNIMFDCIAFDESATCPRLSLHVQSLSYWAPANIGPYSQAIIVGGRIFFSGQIGLIPSTLAMPSPSSLTTETALALQHLHRIKLQLQRTHGVVKDAFFHFLAVWLVNLDDIPYVREVMEKRPLGKDIPTVFLGAKDLPKGASLEVQGMGSYADQDEDDSDGLISSALACQTQRFNSDTLESLVQIATQRETGSFSLIATFKGLSKGELVASLPPEVVRYFPCTTFARVYTTGNGSEVASLFEGTELPLTTIPVRFIGALSRFDWECAIFLAGRVTIPQN